MTEKMWNVVVLCETDILEVSKVHGYKEPDKNVMDAISANFKERMNSLIKKQWDDILLEAIKEINGENYG